MTDASDRTDAPAARERAHDGEIRSARREIEDHRRDIIVLQKDIARRLGTIAAWERRIAAWGGDLARTEAAAPRGVPGRATGGDLGRAVRDYFAALDARAEHDDEPTPDDESGPAVAAETARLNAEVKRARAAVEAALAAQGEAGDGPTDALAAAEAREADLREALHDAIVRPCGVVPQSAQPFYEPARAVRAEARRPTFGSKEDRQERCYVEGRAGLPGAHP